MSSTIRKVCSKCGRSKILDEFFCYKNGERDDLCKDCLLEHVDNGDPDTFLWILERYDIPYIERMWVSMSNREFKANPGRFGPKSVLGKYMRNMKMHQYRKFGYADSDNQELNGLIPQTDQESELDLRKKLESGEITKAEYNTRSSYADSVSRDGESKEYTLKSEYEKSVNDNLTTQDRVYLLSKWGTSYTPEEWVRMESMYNRYCAEYDMSVDREETLKKLCKTSIKMDEALDSDDTLGYKSLSQVFDSLRKTGRFTDQQNKQDRTDLVDSVGRLVQLCERDGGIIEQMPDPEEYPQDKIDVTINNFKQYSVNLLRNEPNIAGLIETYIARLEEADSKTKRFMETMGNMSVPSSPSEDDDNDYDEEEEVEDGS